jgi:hypothetical protein
MRALLLLISLSLPLGGLLAQQMAPAGEAPLTADAIMARVAANQDQAEASRSHYVYVQHAHVVSRKGKSVRCEETTDMRVVPTEKGSKQELLKLDGRLWFKHTYVTYDRLPAKKDVGKSEVDADKNDVYAEIDNDETMDRDLVENMRGNLVNSDREDSKDGVGAGLFPLTSKSQADYTFRLVGRERMNGRDTFHVAFVPKDKDDFTWKGDAWVDSTVFQPVVVRTTMAKQIPFAVRTLLGTSVPGLGFSVVYAPQPGGVWFPVTFGTEFKLHVLFFLNRDITINAENREFEQTHGSATIVAGSAAKQ